MPFYTLFKGILGKSSPTRFWNLQQIIPLPNSRGAFYIKMRALWAGACMHAINPKSETSDSVRKRIALAFVFTSAIRLECVRLFQTNIVTFCVVLSIFMFVIIPCKRVLGSDPPVVADGGETPPPKKTGSWKFQGPEFLGLLPNITQSWQGQIHKTPAHTQTKG